MSILSPQGQTKNIIKWKGYVENITFFLFFVIISDRATHHTYLNHIFLWQHLWNTHPWWNDLQNLLTLNLWGLCTLLLQPNFNHKFPYFWLLSYTEPNLSFYKVIFYMLGLLHIMGEITANGNKVVFPWHGSFLQTTLSSGEKLSVSHV